MPAPDNTSRIDAIFAEARAMTDPAQRAAYLEQACAGDSALRAEVESLLAADQGAADFMKIEVPATEIFPGANAGDKIGRYKLLEKIGEGGFGEVWMAEQEEPVRRRVALKIIKLGMDTKEVVARFEAERQALALMEHPNIARVFDGGATASGRPYFVMELVRGVPLTAFCDAQRLSVEERLKLFMDVCQAVQHAHQKGIIHRDLKPSNVLVSVQDDRPVPKVIDFGIAKATAQRLTEKTLFTRFHQFVGTPAYMSPEQTGANREDIDTRSDIYALGVLLYELLTGKTPLDVQKLLEAGYEAILKNIREQEPPRPSLRLTTLAREELERVAAGRRIAPDKLGKTVRGELDWIVMKCLEKDRARRYATANGLATDLQRHLNSEPVVAAPPSGVYRLQRFVRRHRAGLITASAFVLVLVGGVVMSSIQAWRANRYAREADTQRHAATNEAARATTALADSEQARKRESAMAYANSIALAYREWQNGDETMARATLDACSAELRGWEWYHLQRLANSALWTARVPALASGSEDVSSISGVRTEFTRDGALLAVFGKVVRPEVFDAHTGKNLFEWSPPERRYADFTTFSTDGRWLAVANGTGMKFVDTLEPGKTQDSTQVWQKLIPAESKWISITSKSGELQMTGVPVDLFAIPDSDWQREGLLSPRLINTALGNRFDNDDAFTTEWQGRMTLWVAQSERVRELVRGAKKGDASILHVERAGDDFMLISGTIDGEVSSPLRVTSLTEPGRAWDPRLPSLAIPVRFRFGIVNNILHLFVASVALERSSSGLFVIPLGESSKPQAAHYGVDDARMHPYRIVGEYKYYSGPYYGAADLVLDMERGTMVTAGVDCKVHLWNPRLSQETAVLRGHGAAVSGVAIHPDGKLIASASREGEIGVWDRARPSAAIEIAQMEVGSIWKYLRAFSFPEIPFNPQHGVIACPVKGDEFAIIDLVSGFTRVIPSVILISDDGKRALQRASRYHYAVIDISSGRQFAILPSRPDPTGDGIPLSHFSGNLEWQAFTTNDNREIAFLNMTNGTLSPARLEVTWRPEKQEPADPILAINHDATLMVCRRSLKESAIMRISQTTGAAADIGHIQCSKFIGFLEKDRFAAVVSEDQKTVQVIDIASRAIIEQLPAGEVLPLGESVGINRAGSMLFTLTSRSSVDFDAQPLSSRHQFPVMAHVWSVGDGLLHIALRAVPVSLDLSPDGRRLACSFLDGTVTLVNPREGQTLCSFDEYGYVLGFTADGSSLVTVDPQGRVLMHHGSPIAESRAGIDRSFAESIEAGLANEEARKAAEEKRLALKLRRTLEKPLTSAATVSPVDNTFAVIAQDGLVKIYDFDGKLQTISRAPAEKVSCLAYSPNGTELLLGLRTGQIILWDVEQNSYKVVLDQTNSVERVGWLGSSGRAVIVFGNTDLLEPIVVIDLLAGHNISRFSSTSQRSFLRWAASSDGGTLAIPNMPDKPFGVSMLDAATGRVQAELPGHGPLSIALSRDDRLLAAGHAPWDITIWDWKHKRLLREIEAHSNWVVALAFSPDGKLLLSGGGDSTARVWDTSTGKELGRIRFPGGSTYVDSVGFSPDGRLVLAAAQGRVVIAEAPSRRAVEDER
jgi:serine/threonine protein kinase/WD40 repeat protein